MPGTLSTITSVFPPEERPRAVGIWAGFAGAGGTLGMLGAGWMLASSPGRRSSTSPPRPRRHLRRHRRLRARHPVERARRPRPAGNGPLGARHRWTGARHHRGPDPRLVRPAHRRRPRRRRAPRRGVRAVGAAHRAPAARPAAVPPPRLRHRLGLDARAVPRPVRDLPRDPPVPAAHPRVQRAEGSRRPAADDVRDDPDLGGRRPLSVRFGQKLVGGAGLAISAAGLVAFATLDDRQRLRPLCSSPSSSSASASAWP